MKILYMIPYGGLGNQLFQIAAAMAMNSSEIRVLTDLGFARRNSKGEIELESWEWNSRINFHHSPRGSLFSRRLLNLLLRMGTEKRREVFLRVLELLSTPYFSILLGNLISFEIGKGLGFSRIKIKKRTLLVGYFQSSIFAQSVIDELIQIQPKYLSSLALDLIEEAKRKNILIVHVRRGDYLNEAFGILDDEYYQRALETICYGSFKEIWVFSDDIESAKSIKSLNDKSATKFIDDRSLESSEIMEVMRFGGGFIVANSTFSWWAAQLRYKRFAQVVCPSPWFKFTESPENIVDKEWISLSW